MGFRMPEKIALNMDQFAGSGSVLGAAALAACSIGTERYSATYSYWLLSLHSDWILIDTIDCNSKVLKQVRGGNRCNDIKSRNVLFALAKISAQHSLDLQNKAAANSDHAGVALRIQDR
jgi:hypothetical protein